MVHVRGVLAAIVTGLATALVVLAIAIVPFLNPLWVGFEQERAQAAAWTGYAPMELRAATDAILHDLVLGPPAFDVAVAGRPVLSERERGHMRDVRRVFGLFFLVAAGAAVVLVAAFAASRGAGRAVVWGRVGRAGLVIAAVTVLGGLAVLAFFDAAFSLFHELFFPPGSYLFDPRSERLVQLFPEQFWVETSAAVGVVVAIVGLGLWRLGTGRAARAARAATPRDEVSAGAAHPAAVP